MAQPQEALQSEEVDFLLGSQGPAAETSEPDGGATMQGDLTQVNLADIFQTVAAAQMSGRLRVHNSTDQRDIFFREGLAFNLVPPRIETKRLGQQLIRAGLVTVDEMRSALLEQKKTRIPLTRILADQGLVDPMQMAELTIHICAEDLYSVFTWNTGGFEFYKGEVSDPVLQERLELMQPFDVNGLLLEVARRSDEWQRILKDLRSTDEVLVPLADVDVEALDDGSRELFEALDGRQSVREVGESTLLGLFEAARRLRNLKEKGCIEFADVSTMLDIAEQQIRAGDLKHAAATIQTWRARGEQPSETNVKYMASLLERCGEKRLASSCLIQHAYGLDDAEKMLEFAWEARRLDPRSAEVLQFLQGRMLESETAQPDELVAVTGDLADALENDGLLEEALTTLLELEQLLPSQATNVLRKSRLLHRLGRAEEAIEALLALAEQFKQEKASERVAAVYEQILKIDYRRKDIARALKQIHAAGRGRKLKISVLIACGLLLISIAGWGWMVHRERQAIHAVVEDVQLLLSTGELEAARARLAEATISLGEGPELESLGERIQIVTARAAASIQRERDEALKARMTVAIDHLDRAEIGQAMAILEELRANPDAAKLLEQSVKARLQAQITRLEAIGRDMTVNMPRPPDPLQNEAARRAALTAIEKRYPAAERDYANGLLAARHDPHFPALLPAADLDRLFAAATIVATATAQADDIRQQYQAALNDQQVAKRLDPVFIAAREQERKHDFEAALQSYKRLEEEYHIDDELRAHIRDQVEKFAGILRYLEVLREATQLGDFKTAQSQLRALQRAYPDIPFADLTRLPLAIETRPSGASVRINGEFIGTSPLATSYVPGVKTRVRIEYDGFLTEETVLSGDEVGLVRSLLAPQPLWQANVDGPVHGAPRADGRGQVLVSDRSGRVTRIDPATGRPTWIWASKDLSGLLPPALAFDNMVVVASVDGPLRGLDLQTGNAVWEVPELPCEAAPVAASGGIVVATLTGDVQLINPATGKARWSARMPGAIQAAPAINGERLLVVTTAGHLAAFDVSNGKQTWMIEVGSTVLAAPAADATRVFVAAADGRLIAYDQRSGGRVWTRGGHGDLTVAPVVGEGRVFLASDRRILSYAGDGGTGASWEAPATLTRLQVLHGRLYASRRDGLVTVLAPATLEPMHLLRGGKGSATGLLELADGRLVGGYEDRRLVAFPPVKS